MVIAEQTEGFSFAYLQEALCAFPAYCMRAGFLSPNPFSSVSALVTLLTEKEDGHIVTFESVIKKQIKSLRKQRGEGSIKGRNTGDNEIPAFSRPRIPTEKTDIPLALERLSLMSREGANKVGPIFPAPNRDVRGLLDDLQRNAGSSGSANWF